MATTKKKTAAAAKKTGAKLKNFTKAPINKSLSKDEKIDLYRMIVGIRRFEERSLRAYNQGKDWWLPPPLHWSRSDCRWNRLPNGEG